MIFPKLFREELLGFPIYGKVNQRRTGFKFQVDQWDTSADIGEKVEQQEEKQKEGIEHSQ